MVEAHVWGSQRHNGKSILGLPSMTASHSLLPKAGQIVLFLLGPLTKRTQCITLRQNMGRVQHGYCTTCQLVLPGRRAGYGLRMGNIRSLVISIDCCELSEEFRTFDSPATQPPLALLKMCQGRLEYCLVRMMRKAHAKTR